MNAANPDVKPIDITKYAEFSVDKPAVLTVNSDGEITPRSIGTATVKIGDDTVASLTYRVGEKRVASAETSTITPTALEVATGGQIKFTVDVKYQFGVLMLGNFQTVFTLRHDGRDLPNVSATRVKDELGSWIVTKTASDEPSNGAQEVVVLV